MVGLVEQLQAEALNPLVPVSTLLRKVKVASVKLGLSETLQWVESELKGYEGEVPEYRKGRGGLVGYNPYRGWQTIHFHDARVADITSSFSLQQPIGSYEALVDSPGPFHLPLPANLTATINDMLTLRVPKVAHEVPTGLLIEAVQKVRDLVLDWSLELERAGVTGNGLEFTPAEKAIATHANITIETLNGNLNSGNSLEGNARINLGSNDSSTNSINEKSVFESIRGALKDAQISARDIQDIDERLRDLEHAEDQSAFSTAYQKLIATVSDHITILTPFLPALMQILSSLPA